MKLQAQAQTKLRELVEIGALPASQCGHRAGQLPTQRFRKLDALGVEFEEPKSRRQTKAQRILPQKWIEWSERRWNLQFSKLEAFKKQFGHCNVSKHKGADNGLADWVLNQRKFARSGKLTSERRKRLNRIGFLWRGHNPQYDHWDKRYAKLVAYKKKFGHCDVPCHWKEDRGFGHWVSNQRSFRNKGLLSKGRIARLDKIGFSWSVLPRLEDPPEAFRKWANAQDEAWAFHFARLLAYKKEHGSCNVRQQDGSNGRLHGWVQKQKEIARSGRMPGERHRRLEKLGMAWQGRNCLRELWETRYAQLVAFKKKYGHCDVVCLWKENPALGRWVSNQRVFRKKGKLSNERIARLNKLGFRWVALFDKDAPPECFRPMVDASERLWNSNFASLERYKKKHGHCALTPKEGEEKLYKWVIRQRIKANAGQLPERHRRRLEKLGFVWKGLAYDAR